MAVTDRIYLRNHRRLISQLDVQISRRAFAGSTLDVLYAGDGLSDLDEATREPILQFAEDFLSCGCEGAPFCGHPERAFVRYLLELRMDGFDPEDIVDIMESDYALTAYPADILSFLDDAARYLEAVEALASVEERAEQEADAARVRRALEG